MDDNPVHKACKWLLDIRNSDGGWGIIAGTGASSTITNTGEVTYALSVCNSGPELIQPSVDYICQMVGNKKCGYLRHYAWSCIALLQYGLPADHPCIEQCLRWIRDNRHAEGGWAHAKDGQPSIYPTFLALYALLMAVERGYKPELNKNHASHGVLWLISAQNLDNGWGFAPGGSSIASCTAYAVIALKKFGQQTNERHIASAMSFLASKQSKTGTWDDDIEEKSASNHLKYDFYHFSTPWALIALFDKLQLHNLCLTRTLDGLYQRQLENGGWCSFVHPAPTTFATSQAILALKHSENIFDFQTEVPDIVHGVISLNSRIQSYENVQKEKESPSYFFSVGSLWLRISTTLAHVAVSLYIGVAILLDATIYFRQLDTTVLRIAASLETLVFGLFIYTYARQRKGQSAFLAIATTAGFMGFILTLIQLL